ncbi:hypothetical protein H2204_003473 [Knufia peltigerae]|uniref:Uncharacterized protein n=1 Tax=Knufia peltigerae TaxID=1002370 RepID=A0AA39CZN4_9EURO|nr:hypothetical protein H2204_003473 [Knufia peltigerae]
MDPDDEEDLTILLLLLLVLLHQQQEPRRRRRWEMAEDGVPVTRVAPRGAVTKPKARPSQGETASLSASAAARLLQEQEREQKEQSQYARDRTRKWVESLARDRPQPEASSRDPKTPLTSTIPTPSSQPVTSKQGPQPTSNNDNSKSQKQETQPGNNTHTKQGKRPQAEKRSKRFRSKPPVSFQVKLERSRYQRMIVLDRRRTVKDGAPCEHLDIVGSTGNVYEVVIGRTPDCNCPDALKGNECKHKVYAMHTVLKAPEHLQYQRGLLTSELEEIFARAPPIPSEVGSAADDSSTTKGNRKPTEGECPICYMDLEPKNNRLVWCKAQCGHNLHRSCFDQWVASMPGKEVRCVYCRATWEVDVGDADAVKKAGQPGADGYVNVADQFGMSTARDYSSYHQPWVRRQFGGAAT